MKIKFLGAAGTVTGSKYLLESESGQQIMIDCGLFQGVKNLRLRNWTKLPINHNKLLAVILTHAHLDHSGYLPKLVKDGFRGHIYATAATKAVAQIILEDSAKLKEEEAEYANKKKFTRHKPAQALYYLEDVDQTMQLFRTHKFNESFKVGDFEIKFRYAGHILGAASVEVRVDGRSILFSGDLGRPNDLLMHPPATPTNVDYLVVESTYGSRTHDQDDPLAVLEELLTKVIERKSVLLIPSFAVGRAQTLVYCFAQIFKKNPDLQIPLYLNSPMADKVTKLYEQFCDEHKLSQDRCHEVSSAARHVQSVKESRELNERHGPMVIISASGMLTGGRILHHLNAFGEDPNNIIVFPGFQAEGTRGGDLVKGQRDIKFFGYYHTINAEILQYNFFSAHADQKEIIDWIDAAEEKPSKIFIVHGENHEADTLRRKLQESFDNIETHVAIDQEEIEL